MFLGPKWSSVSDPKSLLTKGTKWPCSCLAEETPEANKLRRGAMEHIALIIVNMVYNVFSSKRL